MGFTPKLSVQRIFKKVRSVGSLLHMGGFAFQVWLTKRQHLKANSSGFSTKCKSMKNGWAPHMLKAKQAGCEINPLFIPPATHSFKRTGQRQLLEFPFQGNNPKPSSTERSQLCPGDAEFPPGKIPNDSWRDVPKVSPSNWIRPRGSTALPPSQGMRSGWIWDAEPRKSPPWAVPCSKIWRFGVFFCEF